MDYPIPGDQQLNTTPLSKVFKNTTATYKYYWFLSILDEFVKNGKERINIWEIIISMISQAWYPVHYFRLSFGKGDSMYSAIKEIQRLTKLPIDANANIIQERLNEEHKKGNTSINAKLRKFIQCVPYCFLSPWLHESSKSKVIALTQDYNNNVLYKLGPTTPGNMDIVINDKWADYLTTNYQILKDFTF